MSQIFPRGFSHDFPRFFFSIETSVPIFSGEEQALETPWIRAPPRYGEVLWGYCGGN